MARIAALCLGLMAAATPVAASEVEGARAAELKHLVIQDCGSCHGLTMKGGLGRPITRDLMQHYDREILRDIILDGIPGTAMPPWRPLMSEADAMWIADYLRGVDQ
ncbi:c-type cytochrome [Ovoidimarina sediminis]|uniref:c-type cytochrome n=1 Tax=Ovoidimarina sediminis TaxID=3079856 RepID=UPI002914A14A|nr:cytochrome c [Rhodophyticola sp. MJ-SS7]MDU8941845.1 cytochrome c [Rhodophyticola sp. MJ-SS7]